MSASTAAVVGSTSSSAIACPSFHRRSRLRIAWCRTSSEWHTGARHTSTIGFWSRSAGIGATQTCRCRERQPLQAAGRRVWTGRPPPLLEPSPRASPPLLSLANGRLADAPHRSFPSRWPPRGRVRFAARPRTRRATSRACLSAAEQPPPLLRRSLGTGSRHAAAATNPRRPPA
eukprot:166931-Chlamydomonas_euryale.AAC.1